MLVLALSQQKYFAITHYKPPGNCSGSGKGSSPCAGESPECLRDLGSSVYFSSLSSSQGAHAQPSAAVRNPGASASVKWHEGCRCCLPSPPGHFREGTYRGISFSFKHLLLPWPWDTPGPTALLAAPIVPILSQGGWTRNLPQQQDPGIPQNIA